MTGIVFIVSMLCTAVQPGDLLAPAAARCQMERASAAGSERAGLIRHLLPEVRTVRITPTVNAWSSTYSAPMLEGRSRLVVVIPQSPNSPVSHSSRPIRAPSCA